MGLFTKSLFQKLTKAPPIFERKEQSMDENQRNFTGVFIPAEIYENEELSWSDKILWAEIQALSGKTACRASNAHFAKHLKSTEHTISKSIAKLKKLGFVKQVGFDGRTRELIVCFSKNEEQDSMDKKVKAEYSKKSSLSNPKSQGSIDIYNNNKYIPSEIQDEIKENNINKFILKESLQSEPAKKTPKRFIKPTLEEIKEYCQERNNGLDPEKFINYYESKGWVVGKSPMKDWKAAVRTWEKSGYNQPKAEQPTQAGTLPPPTLEEWLEFSDSLELDDDVMKKAYQYYQDADWYDRSGKKIFNWKQKIRAVWDKDENKIIKPRVFVID